MYEKLLVKQQPILETLIKKIITKSRDEIRFNSFKSLHVKLMSQFFVIYRLQTELDIFVALIFGASQKISNRFMTIKGLCDSCQMGQWRYEIF